MNISPSEQHDTQAKKILARRAGMKNNEAPAKEDEVVDGGTDNGGDDNAVDFGTLGRKELRVLCQEAGIEFKKKDTIAVLIGKLEG